MSKKAKWKKLLKPIVKECIMEVLIENGIKESIGQITDGILEESLSVRPKSTPTVSNFGENNFLAGMRENMLQDFPKPTKNKPQKTKTLKNDIKGQGSSNFNPLGDLDDNDAGVDLSLIFGRTT